MNEMKTVRTGVESEERGMHHAPATAWYGLSAVQTYFISVPRTTDYGLRTTASSLLLCDTL